MQLPAVHGYGHGVQVGGKYLCHVVGKQLPDCNVGLSINYVDIANNFAMSEICPSFTQGLKKLFVLVWEAICQNTKQCQ